MKTIEAIPMWDKGESKEGNRFICYSTFDNFHNSATIYFAIFSDLEKLADGNLSLDGDDYQAWDLDQSANEWAYNWTASKLNLTITGDYVATEVNVEN